MKRFLTILLIALMAGAMAFAVPTFTGNAKINLDYNTIQNQHTWDAYMGGDGLAIGFTDDLWAVNLQTGSMDINSDGGITATLKLGAIIAKSIGYQTKSTIDLDFGWGSQKASMYYTGHSADTSIYGDLNKLGSVAYAKDLIAFKKLTLANQISDDKDSTYDYNWSSGFTGKATIGYAGLKLIGAVAVNERAGAVDPIGDPDLRKSFGFAIEGANLAEFINFSAGLNIGRGLNSFSADIGDVYIWKINANFDLGKVFGWGIGLKVDGFAQFVGNQAIADVANFSNYAGQVTGQFGRFSAYVEYTNQLDIADLGRISNINVGGAWQFNPIFSLSANLAIPALGKNWATEGDGVELGFDAGVTAAYGSFTAYAGATKGVWKNWNNEVGFKSNFKFVF